MMKSIALSALALLLFSGCTAKTQFKPSKVDASLEYQADMKSELVDVSREGATYANGRVLSQSRGLLKEQLPKGFRFVFDSGNAVLVSDENGVVKVLSEEKELFSHKFDFALSSGSIKGNSLALVLSNNTLLLYDMTEDAVRYTEALEPTFANDARLANPLFLNDLVIFPTLDGRLLIMDAVRNMIVRDVAISDKKLFNNVIFLQEHRNVLVAATGSKVISIDPKNINSKRLSVKDIVFDTNAIYIFSKTGKIIKTDLNLKVLKEIKLPFAIYSAVMSTNKLYAVEKSGYLIEVDKNLETTKIYALPSKVDKPVFAFKNRLFMGQNFLKIQ